MVYALNFIKFISNRTLRSNSYPCCSMQWSFKDEVCEGEKLHWFWSFSPKTECGSTKELRRSGFSWTKGLWRDNRKSLKAALQGRRLLLKLCKIKRHQIFLFGYNTCISTNSYSLLASWAEVCFCKLESKDLGGVLFYKDFPIPKRCFDSLRSLNMPGERMMLTF